MEKLTRREALKVFGVGAAGTALGPAFLAGRGRVAHASREGGEAPEVSEMLDVAIIGAGVSGLYTGWRLLGDDAGGSTVLKPLVAARGNGALEVGLFEMGTRIGGRLYSVEPEGMPSLRAEIGGMRFLTSQTFTVNLVEELGLEVQDFPFGDPNNLQYLRQQRFRFGDWKTPGSSPYYLASDDQGKEPNELLTEAIEQYVSGARDLTPEEWDEVKKTGSVDGVPLTDFGFQNLLLRAKGVEAHDVILDAGSYYTLEGDWNAAEAMAYLLSDFPGNPTYKRLAEGFQALPEELAERFTQAGGKLLPQHRLRLLEQTQVDGEPAIRLSFDGEEGQRTYHARHVVLAMPRRSLELLDQNSFLFSNQQFLSDLQSVTPQAAAKMFLSYERPWWQDIGLTGGRSDTDLPMRQCYYWGAESDQPGADPDNTNSLLMASYHDGVATRFWGSFLDVPPYVGTLPTVLDPKAPTEPEYGSAPDLMLEEIQRQLQELHGSDASIPDPYDSMYFNWAQDPYGGGWHFWNVFTKPWEVMPRIRKPVEDANLYICGEAYSTDQGWVVGALNTAEKVLEDHFGMSRPSWLPSDYFLGS